jgi:peptidylprolyl isomerase
VRRFIALPVAVLALGSLVLAGCGGSSGKPTKTTTKVTNALPTVSGGYGDKPTITFPAGNPTDQLRSKILVQGHGPVVAKGDVVAFDYLGQIWHGKVFDNSYDRHEPLISQIGERQLIPAWDKDVPGVRTGSRMLLIVPPVEGYGSQGNAQAGIKGTDTLAFVIDIIGTYGKTAAGDPHATREKSPPAGITVTGALGKPATVKVAKGTKPPKKQQVIVLARGHGPKVQGGNLVVQYAAGAWSGKKLASTWTVGHPTEAGVGNAAQPSPFDSLLGLPLGSRVLLLIPPTSGGDPKKQSDAVVVDLVAEPKPANAS